jgi:SlyX protein
MTEDRLTNLEVRYAYLERTVGDLDQVVIELRGEIAKLKRELKDLSGAVREGDDNRAPPQDEKPPHY